MAMLRAPSMNGLDGPVVPFYRKCEMAGVITYLYLLQKSARIVGEPSRLVKILDSLSGKTRNFRFP